MSGSINLFEDALVEPRAFRNNSEYKRLEELCYTTRVIKIPSVDLTSISTWFVQFNNCTSVNSERTDRPSFQFIGPVNDRVTLIKLYWDKRIIGRRLTG